MYVRERERERETETETETETERQADRETGRQTDRQTEHDESDVSFPNLNLSSWPSVTLHGAITARWISQWKPVNQVPRFRWLHIIPVHSLRVLPPTHCAQWSTCIA